MHVMFFITVQLKDHSKLFALILFLLIRILTNQTLVKQFSLCRSKHPGIKVFAATNKPVKVFLCCFKDLFFWIVIPTLNYLIIIVIKVDRFLWPMVRTSSSTSIVNRSCQFLHGWIFLLKSPPLFLLNSVLLNHSPVFFYQPIVAIKVPVLISPHSHLSKVPGLSLC